MIPANWQSESKEGFPEAAYTDELNLVPYACFGSNCLSWVEFLVCMASVPQTTYIISRCNKIANIGGEKQTFDARATTFLKHQY